MAAGDIGSRWWRDCGDRRAPGAAALLDSGRMHGGCGAAFRGTAGFAGARAGAAGPGAGGLRPPGGASHHALGPAAGGAGASASKVAGRPAAAADPAHFRGMEPHRLGAAAGERDPCRCQRLQRAGAGRARGFDCGFRRRGVLRDGVRPGGGAGVRHARQGGPAGGGGAGNGGIRRTAATFEWRARGALSAGGGAAGHVCLLLRVADAAGAGERISAHQQPAGVGAAGAAGGDERWAEGVICRGTHACRNAGMAS